VSAPVVLAIRNDPTDPPGYIQTWLEQAGLQVQVIEADLGQSVPARVPLGVSGILAMGGTMGAWDDEDAPWLADERSLLADATSQDLPTLGVCLGHQLLAVAVGGSIERAPQSEIGLSRLELTDLGMHDDLARHLVIDNGVPASQWHQDHVTELPSNARLLLTNAACRVQGFRIGCHVYGLQCHPELDAELFESWALDDDPALVRSSTNIDLEMDRIRSIEPLMLENWRMFVHRWADLVRAYDLKV